MQHSESAKIGSGRTERSFDMKNVYIETYGCQMNIADTETVFGLLGCEGYDRTEDPSQADLILINTCAVRESAERRVFGRLGELRRYKRPGVVIGVLGCMAQRLGKRLLDAEKHVDLVLGPDGYRLLPQLVAAGDRGERNADVGFRSLEHYEGVPRQRSDAVRAFVTVQRGCNYRCTFCVVPMTRGRERSRNLTDVVREVETLVGQGVTEVTLLGQTVNSYRAGEADFADLLRAVGGTAGIRRVRFTSPYPSDFTGRVVEAIAVVPEVCEHVHLPVQSGSSRILKRMGRRYTRDDFVRCVARLRAAVPAIAITTDVIVGFPGETEDDFEETISLLHEVGFDDAFTFKHSPRDGTAALRLPDHVPEQVKGERLDRTIQTVRAIASKKNLGLVDTIDEVLVEGIARRGGLLQARTRSHRVVLLEGPEAWVGSYVDVRLTGTTGATFTGVPIS